MLIIIGCGRSLRTYVRPGVVEFATLSRTLIKVVRFDKMPYRPGRRSPLVPHVRAYSHSPLDGCITQNANALVPLFFYRYSSTVQYCTCASHYTLFLLTYTKRRDYFYLSFIFSKPKTRGKIQPSKTTGMFVCSYVRMFVSTLTLRH